MTADIKPIKGANAPYKCPKCGWGFMLYTDKGCRNPDCDCKEKLVKVRK